jgi:hypothetical protein
LRARIIIERMTLYTEELGKLICERVASGELVYKVCQDDGMPDKRTVYAWSFQRPEFGERFRAALVQRAENWGEGIIEDIEICGNSPEAIAKLKILTDTKRWIMGKLLKNYADKVTLQGDKDNPIQVSLAAALDQRIAAARTMPTIEHQAGESLLPVIDVE